MKSAIDHSQFDRTKAAPARRVVPETKSVTVPGGGSAVPPVSPNKTSGQDARATKKEPTILDKLVTPLVCLLLLIGSNVTLATTVTFTFTNDIAVPMTTMFYTNTSSGYVFYNATNTINGTSNTLSTSFAVQGVAVQATNADLARLAPFASLPALGSSVSLIISNTAYYSAGVPKNTGQFGTNIAAGSSFTTAVGTNLNSSSAFNTNLP